MPFDCTKGAGAQIRPIAVEPAGAQVHPIAVDPAEFDLQSKPKELHGDGEVQHAKLRNLPAQEARDNELRAEIEERSGKFGNLAANELPDGSIDQVGVQVGSACCQLYYGIQPKGQMPFDCTNGDCRVDAQGLGNGSLMPEVMDEEEAYATESFQEVRVHRRRRGAARGAVQFAVDLQSKPKELADSAGSKLAPSQKADVKVVAIEDVRQEADEAQGRRRRRRRQGLQEVEMSEQDIKDEGCMVVALPGR
jgi:hypothetical protein